MEEGERYVELPVPQSPGQVWPAFKAKLVDTIGAVPFLLIRFVPGFAFMYCIEAFKSLLESLLETWLEMP